MNMDQSSLNILANTVTIKFILIVITCLLYSVENAVGIRMYLKECNVLTVVTLPVRNFSKQP